MVNCEWFTLRVKTGKENSVKEFIEKEKTEFGIIDEIKDIYIPIKKKIDIVEGKKRIKEKNEYPGYIFINADMNDQKVIDLLKITPDLFGHKYSSAKPGLSSQPLSRKDIDKLFGTTKANEPQYKNYLVGDIVKIISGPFSNFEGKIISIDKKNQSMGLNVSIFSRDTQIEVLFADVEKF